MSNAKNRAEELLDELIKGKTAEELIGQEGLLKQLTKSLVERAMQGEITHHLGYERKASSGNNSGNSRNGKSIKKVKEILVQLIWKFHEIETGASNHRSFRRVNLDLPALTIRSSRCIRVE
ncbi:transposase, mutator-like family protein [Leptospira weilii serovar Topaz str. LT2116]|uniref:Transposase, mutator-like family protein n=1 Tax=Leptospira weilii serovar Topaz str. LT2116 TaxID=1088540 RepID=M3GAX8_9LEPT|nr:transposase, mutator-like family protein [Leptospira weilii serovar Topaz str. LT2116]